MTSLARPRLTREQREALDALGSEKRQLFVIYYTGEAKHNGALAARMAGYSEETAKSIACELLTLPDVQRAIAAFDRPVRDKAIMGKREAQRMLSRMARGEEPDVVVTKEGPLDVRPSHHTRNGLIRTLAELRGWNAAKKHDVNVKSGPKTEAEARTMVMQWNAELGIKVFDGRESIEMAAAELGGRVVWEGGDE